jgi:CHAT domain-containing protein
MVSASPAAESLLASLVALPDADAQRHFLRQHAEYLDDAFAEALKEQVLQAQRADRPVSSALQLADLVQYLAEVTGERRHRALGLRAEAQVRAIEMGEYQRALELYAQAIAIYQAENDELGQALTQVTRIWALANLSRYDEAFEAGRWASLVLAARQQWRYVATLTMNLAAIYGRLGEDARSLEMLDAAGDAALRLGPDGERLTALVEQNRAIVLRNLGRFEAAIRASQQAFEMNTRLGQHTSAARARQNLGVTYFVLGRFNEGLHLLDQAREFFLAEGRQRDALLVEISISDGLLQLRRFGDVLEKSCRVREVFTSQGTRFEVGQALLNEALAFSGLGRYDEARASLQEARRLFEAEKSQVWAASAELEAAALLGRQGQHALSLAQAAGCRRVFAGHGLALKDAQARLVMARAHSGLGRPDQALELARGVVQVGQEHGLPALLAAGHHLLADLAAAAGRPAQALADYDAALQALERLRGRLMIEHRAGFLEDKHALYEGAVALCLDLGQPQRALDYAERAKSRALLDLLAFRLDLGLQARDPADQPLVDELLALRAERNRLYRRLAGGEAGAEAGQQQAWGAAVALEQRITERWHTLLIRNADYAREAAVWQVHSSPIQPHLQAGTLLVEYFQVRGSLVAFLVSRDQVEAVPLAAEPATIAADLQLLWHNFKAVPHAPPGSGTPAALERNARGLLQRLYAQLLAPLDDRLAPYADLIVVPHGPLHYLPFHALHDGSRYLIQRHSVRYLPGGSFVRFGAAPGSGAGRLLALGHSADGRLPHAIEETRAIAAQWGGRALLEESATLEAWRGLAPRHDILHLAAHGEFRPDNPLFSGLALADGWLTTLEVFNLRLNASLVCLSGCQTGRSLVSGGDELLGLMRAFLYAGAASLVLSLWAVEDRSAADLMCAFYSGLAAGQTKSAALRQAQLQALSADDGRLHPYYWAPFFLVGDGGPL